MTTASDPQLAVAISRLQNLSDDMQDVKRSISQLADAFTRLAVVEERQSSAGQAMERAFGALGRHETRIGALELAQPVQQQSSDWVQKIIAITVAAVLGGVITTAMRPPTKEPALPPPTVERRT